MLPLIFWAALAAAGFFPAPRGPIDAARLSAVGTEVEAAIARHELPGAVVVVRHRGRTVFRKAYGDRAVLPEREPMTPDTIFDVASLTKVVVTAPSILMLIEAGKVRSSDPVVRYVPEFAAGGGDRSKVTVEQLLTHRAGLVPDDPIEIYAGSREEIFARKHAQPLQSRPGSEFVYSDVGYELLGEVVRRVSGEELDVFAEKRIFRPLRMKDTGFRRPGSARDASRVAPTEQREGRWMRGEVHDPRAYAVGGVAGHAGLFSTADDLARFCRMILNGGSLDGALILSPLGVDALTRPRFYGDGNIRALGFDVATTFSSPGGDLFPAGSFGHTGFTGTSLWIDPGSQTFVILLSNRVHPDGKGDVVRLRSVVSSIVAAALSPAAAAAARRLDPKIPARPREVQAGVDVLVARNFGALAGKRVGLVTNASGLARDGRTTAEVLASAEAKKAGVTLVRLFSPEHGPKIDADDQVSDQTDPATGLPVVSLYGERRRPSPEDLSGLDALVFDVQDVGVRFYTYPATGGYLLEAAAQAKIPLVVLDRPDPIGGLLVEGPLADPDKLSFTAYHEIPVRYGMTPGELMRLFNAERKIGAAVQVVEMRGWSRDLWFDETGLEWVNPSPNMRSLNAAALYPGVGLLETTNVSVGRGTDTPFEILGAPWIDASRLAAYLSARKIPGVRFTPIHFTPAASVHVGARCGGVRITLTDRGILRAAPLGIEIASALRSLYPGDWDRSRLGALIANADTVSRIERGDSPEAIVASWAPGLADFEARRAKWFLYPVHRP
ncbi:MAG: exo-beta-N-acetylmuramidase NamZ domain-containing protein [Acidobacteriota bacterium]